MKNTKWMKEMTSAELAEAVQSGIDTVIIPGGAYEVYGPQLPLGSDSIVSAAICERVAAKTNAIIGPFFEVGESASLYGFPGTIKILPDTYYRVMEDIVNSLVHWGFKNFMFINMHAGNVPIITQLAREKQREFGIKCGQVKFRFIIRQVRFFDVAVERSHFFLGEDLARFKVNVLLGRQFPYITVFKNDYGMPVL